MEQVHQYCFAAKAFHTQGHSDSVFDGTRRRQVSYRDRNFMTVRLELAMDELGSVDDSVKTIDGSLVELGTNAPIQNSKIR
jgi:hypothetical protein